METAAGNVISQELLCNLPFTVGKGPSLKAGDVGTWNYPYEPAHYKVLCNFSLHLASTLVVLPNFLVLLRSRWRSA